MTRITEFMPRVTDGYVGDVEPGELIVVQIAGHIKAFWFMCPCGCGDLHMLPSGRAEGADNPIWSLTAEADGTFSASPSILRRGGCGSHYFIEHCVVRWC